MQDAVSPIVAVEHLSVSYRQGQGFLRVVDDVNFTIAPGEVFGLVGESGCGKSTVALQLLGYRPPAMRTDGGAIRFDGHNLLALGRPDLDRLRGARIAFVPQNPTTALNPGIRVGGQIDEALAAHGFGAPQKRVGRTRELFDLVGLPAAADFLARFPHQLSGGQQQRVCIAMALACDPAFVVLDEPTTGLDVTTQEQIIALLIALRARLAMSMLYVTHDLALLSQIADRVGVMYAGRMVEIAPTAELFSNPKHPYTRGLIGSIPRIDDRSGLPARPLRGLLQRHDLPPGCPFAPRCDWALPLCSTDRQALQPAGPRREVACWRWPGIVAPADDRPVAAPVAAATNKELLAVENVSVVYGRPGRGFTAIRDITLNIREGETFALVGESGSGKSTLARAVAGLIAPTSGRISLSRKPLAGRVKQRDAEERQLIQFVFQNPDASLNPRARISRALARPLEFFFGSKAEAPVVAALADVRLDAKYANRFPDELSGGERQRVAIARGLIAEPSLLLCDEILSALDVSVQASILALLQRLKAERGIAMLFISHDLAVVRMLADRVCVLFAGDIMEMGPRDQVFSAPFHPYTHSLLDAVPTPLRSRPDASRKPETARPPTPDGCAYAGRCAWRIGDICDKEAPPWRKTPEGLNIRCHHPLDELERRATWPNAPEVSTNAN
ncbi:dipeptide ABC transporter ATP-binding protein [Mesorhizobium sp. AR07]|uniref:ABC transporter ATP-binding protein n=1 Tax=Mesorhizobium sp. AR07 TaxID=2865838 RepID=UPI00215E87FE|nr:dipeptide ABC transporter ATP-binding protein [Mesorhizobium sp. AR07]UVK43872.1 dipeptide ABC transporter ATP-binding protein [Mesorhizobium sp. AR07]